MRGNYATAGTTSGHVEAVLFAGINIKLNNAHAIEDISQAV
jgi:hypothetical protein